MKSAIYIVYENDIYQFEGTAEYVAEKLGIKIDTVKWYGTPTGIQRCMTRKKPRREIVKALSESTSNE